MDDVFVQFQGFHPSTFTRDFLDLKFDQIHEKSPYGSTLRAVFVRNGERLKATLRIMSAAGTFVAVSEGQKMRDVSKRLFSQIGRQLERWKSTRYKDEDHDAIRT
jgi:hypothetical protein